MMVVLLQESSYYPQVEAISPTPTDTRDDSPDLNKSHIVKQIESVDSEISKYENHVKFLTKKTEDITAAMTKDEEEVVHEEWDMRTKDRTLAQTIYAANKVGASLYSAVLSVPKINKMLQNSA